MDKIKVRKQKQSEANSTDVTLLVTHINKDEITDWDCTKIVESIQKELNIDELVAIKIAKNVEKKVFKSELKNISTSLIRELVDNELFEMGLNKKLQKESVLSIPIYDLEKFLFSKSNENSNIGMNNPEAVNLFISETILKDYMLRKVFSKEVSKAHLKGAIHIHDLGYPRTYCSSHSIEYIKKYGLELGNLFTSSSPAKHARTLTGHINTFLSSIQAYYAGALGLAYLNIFYAPYLEGLSDKEIRQEAQYLIYSTSQNAFSRGSQSLFIDFNIHFSVPCYLRGVKAIGRGGVYTGKTYGDYEELAQKFAKAMLEVFNEGDRYGRLFPFPKADCHIEQDTFTDPKQKELLVFACEIASKNGSPYFVFDRGSEAQTSACCRLKTTITDPKMITNPEGLRFCGFQNVTINLPQAGYKAKGNKDRLYREIEKAMEVALKAHFQKKNFIQKMMRVNRPMYDVARVWKDGNPYIDLEKSTYIFGIIGLNECLQTMFGKELHESQEVFKEGLKIISFMNKKTKEFKKEYGLNFTLEESPAESACGRLARVDIANYPEAETCAKGEGEIRFYTNSIHYRADAPIDLLTRIKQQSKFHSMIESGAIIHAFVGEQQPSPKSILELVKKTYEKTNTAQLTISPEFTECEDCHHTTRGLLSECPKCNSKNVSNITRIVGYFSKVNNWNPYKMSELKDRKKGNYQV